MAKARDLVCLWMTVMLRVALALLALALPAHAPRLVAPQHGLSNSTLEWWRWVVVRVANQAAWVPLNDTLGAREAFVEAFDPDLFDWGGDYRWQAGEWAALRGLPVAHATQFEYQTAFNGFNVSAPNASVVTSSFGADSVQRNASGAPVVDGLWPFMTHAAPLWHTACVQGAARVGRRVEHGSLEAVAPRDAVNQRQQVRATCRA